MLIELRCPECPCRFCAAADTPSERILDRMTEEGPWYTLGPGKTFKDMVSAALLTRGRILCPDCRCPLLVGREGLSEAKPGGFLPQWGMLLGMILGAAGSVGVVFAFHPGTAIGAPYSHLGLFISDIALGILFGATLGVMLGLWASEKLGGACVPSVRRMARRPVAPVHCRPVEEQAGSAAPGCRRH